MNGWNLEINGRCDDLMVGLKRFVFSHNNQQTILIIYQQEEGEQYPDLQGRIDKARARYTAINKYHNKTGPQSNRFISDGKKIRIF